MSGLTWIDWIYRQRRVFEDRPAIPERLDHIRTVVSSASQQHIQTIASNIPTSQDLALLWQSGVKLVSGDFLQEEPRVIGQ